MGSSRSRWFAPLADLRWWSRYERGFLRADLVGGLTVGAMLVPQCIAYAELAGMPPEAGFRAALLPLLVYALVGSSRHLGVGPEPGTAILAATGVAALAAGDATRYVSLMATLALLVGVIGIAASLMRFGFLADLLSKPVLVGYITGVGLTLLTSQFGKITGIPIQSSSVFPRISELVAGLGRFEPATFILFASTLFVILYLKRTHRTLPGALIGVALASLAATLFDLPAQGVRLIGTIPSGLPRFTIPTATASDVMDLLPVAFGVALIGYTDNVLTARSVASRLGYRIHSNQELLALGAINAAAGLSGGFPISSSASRTAVPATLGSHTQVVGLVAAAFLLASTALLGRWLSFIPQAALGAVIVSAAIAIIDVEGLRSLQQRTRPELAIAILTALAVMALDVLSGVLLAVVASVLWAFARMAVPHDSVLAAGEGLDGWVDADLYGEGTTLPGLLVYRFDAPLFFANATRFRERIAEVIERNPGREEWIVLDFEGIGDVDATALDVLAEVVAEQTAAQRTVSIARANERALKRVRLAGLCAPEGPVHIYPTILSAVRAFEAREGRPSG